MRRGRRQRRADAPRALRLKHSAEDKYRLQRGEMRVQQREAVKAKKAARRRRMMLGIPVVLLLVLALAALVYQKLL